MDKVPRYPFNLDPAKKTKETHEWKTVTTNRTSVCMLLVLWSVLCFYLFFLQSAEKVSNDKIDEGKCQDRRRGHVYNPPPICNVCRPRCSHLSSTIPVPGSQTRPLSLRPRSRTVPASTPARSDAYTKPAALSPAQGK